MGRRIRRILRSRKGKERLGVSVMIAGSLGDLTYGLGARRLRNRSFQEAPTEDVDMVRRAWCIYIAVG